MSGSGGPFPVSTEGFKSLGQAALTVVVLGLLLSLPLRNASPSLTAGKDKAPSSLAAAPSTCYKLVNSGGWRTSDCSSKGVESEAGQGGDPQAVAGGAAAACTVEAWEWYPDVASCHFHPLSPLEAKDVLSGRKVTLIGDSIGRKVYYGLLTTLGSPSEQAHNTSTERHKDLTFRDPEGNLDISFLWRPYVKVGVARELWGVCEGLRRVLAV